MAALAGAAIAFPAGVYFGRSPAPAEIPRPRAGSASVRNHYSPALLSNPAFIDQQRRLVEALEASCRRSNMHCTEARAAHQSLTELESGR